MKKSDNLQSINRNIPEILRAGFPLSLEEADGDDGATGDVAESVCVCFEYVSAILGVIVTSANW